MNQLLQVKRQRWSGNVFARRHYTEPDAQPTGQKWMLDDPRVNFAISTRRQPVGINHVGFQVDTDEELRSMHAQLEAADARLVQELEQPCCYARSDKYWVTDPSGIAWETFHTLGSISGLRRSRRASLLLG